MKTVALKYSSKYTIYFHFDQKNLSWHKFYFIKVVTKMLSLHTILLSYESL